MRCNLRCESCDDAKGREYPGVRYSELGQSDALRLISLIVGSDSKGTMVKHLQSGTKSFSRLTFR